MTRDRCLLSLALLAGLLACDEKQADPPPDPYRILTESLEVTIHEMDGTVDVTSLSGDGVAIHGLHVAAELVVGREVRRIATRGRPLSCQAWREVQAWETIVEARECIMELDAGLRVELSLGVAADAPGALFWGVSFSNMTGEDLTVRKLQPFRLAAAEGGAVWLGDDPADVRILQNGRDEIVDFYVDLLPGDLPLSDPDEIPLVAAYSSYSNGHVLAHDLESGASLLVGFLELDWATPLVALAGDPQAAVDADGRTPLTDLVGEGRYPEPVPWPNAHVVGGGNAVLILGQPTPFDALETYADRLARFHDVQLPEKPLSGWDSWYTSFAFTELDDRFVTTNADGLAELFGDYGLDSMQLDLGWQDTWGDWNARDELTQGMAGLAGYIQGQGLTPELWIAPLSAEESSQVYQDHADDWFVPKNMYGQVLMEQAMHPLDLTRADVLAHVRGLAEQIRDWGYGSVKLDFAYYILYSEFPPHHLDTPTALYRKAVREFRAGLGPDMYLININAAVPNYGLVDAFRIGLDDWPCWEGGDDCSDYVNAPGISAQGIKPAVRMAARRYWLNGRVWWNHMDQLFFRDQTPAEAQAFASLVGLSGGMISLGEDVRNLAPEHVDVYRRILPLTGRTARPLDLFEREFPEVWHLAQGEGAARVDVVGLFHWGANRDLTTWPPTERPDGEILNRVVLLADLGLDSRLDYLAYEYWSGAVRVVRDGFQADLPPHWGSVFRIVRQPEQPDVIGANRHLLMGPEAFSEVRYNAGARELTGTVETVQGFAHTLTVWAPDGITVSTAGVDGVDAVTWEERSVSDRDFSGTGLVVLKFTGAATGPQTFTVQF